MKTSVTLEVEHKQPIPQIGALAAQRVYELKSVGDVRVLASDLPLKYIRDAEPQETPLSHSERMLLAKHMLHGMSDFHTSLA